MCSDISMSSDTDPLPKHTKYWCRLGDKIVDAVVKELIESPNVGQDGQVEDSESLQVDETIEKLTKYHEVYRRTLEGFYPPEDTAVLQAYAAELVAWFENLRKELVPIDVERRKLLEESRKLLEEKEKKDAIKAAIEHRARAMHAMMSRYRDRRSPSLSQDDSTSEITITEEVEHTVVNIGPGVSTAQVLSSIERISSGLQKLATARNANTAQLQKLKDEVSKRKKLQAYSQSMLMRPIDITQEDVHRVTASIVNCNARIMVRAVLRESDIAEEMEEDYQTQAERVHNALEIPLRTIGIQMKKLKLNAADSLAQEY